MDSQEGNLDLRSDSPNISRPLNRPSQNGPWSVQTNHETAATVDDVDVYLRNQPSLPPDIRPGERKSLSGISIRAFLLGLSLGLNSLVTLYLLLIQNSDIWRAPFFLSTLSLFHFLEFWTTAAFNTRYANISAFLLSRNGSAYNIAHTGAFLECLLTNLLFPHRTWLSPIFHLPLLLSGLSFIIIGQVTRTVAMAQAGTNFNHTVQMKRSEGHELVTSGIYGWLRHPSYFGFFWWGLGTQLVMGNVVCFVAYAGVLWRFFSRRIGKEEELLVSFFGKEYVEYRQRTSVGIPFIR
ncbi:MAG: hypothetical protein M1827_002653 [Pycnora praestabilis]|nr:MAG: hypothetical protein M1827_002653 [Pycnora praestabilis]